MEYKNMEKVFLGIISGTIPDEPVRATHAILDFIYFAQYPSHSTVTLAHMQDALRVHHKYGEYHGILVTVVTVTVTVSNFSTLCIPCTLTHK